METCLIKLITWEYTHLKTGIFKRFKKCLDLSITILELGFFPWWNEAKNPMSSLCEWELRIFQKLKPCKKISNVHLYNRFWASLAQYLLLQYKGLGSLMYISSWHFIKEINFVFSFLWHVDWNYIFSVQSLYLKALDH